MRFGEQLYCAFVFGLRTSATVSSINTSGMMIGRGNGRDQFGAGNSAPHANYTTAANIVIPRVESIQYRLFAREPRLTACFGLIVMPDRFEDQPWYPEWKKAVDRVVAPRGWRSTA